MRRREFLLVFAAAGRLVAQHQPMLSGRRGVHIPDSNVEIEKLLEAKVQFVTLPFRFKPPQSLLEDLKRNGIAVESRRAERLVGGRFVRLWRPTIAVGHPFEANYVRAIANGCAFEARLDDLQELGPVFRRFLALDPWTLDAIPISDILVVGDYYAVNGPLLDLHEQFDISLDDDADYSAYRLVIVPNPKKTDPKKAEAYRKFGGTIYTPPANITREAFSEALRTYVPKPAVIAPGLPAEAEVTFLERRTPGGIRRTGHVLYYPNDKPGVLENVQLSFRLPQHPLGVITIPDQRPVEFVHNEFLTTFTLPRVTGHQAIAFE